MKEPIFYLPKKKYAEESTVITLRIPADMLRDIDSAAKASHRTRNEILALALELSLGNLVVTEAEQPEATGEGEKLIL